MTRAPAPAGFWRRAAALGVDALWLFCVCGALAYVLFGQPWPSPALTGPANLGIRLVHQLLPAAVFIVGWARWGATPGKVLLGLRVVGPGGGPPGPVRALIRCLGYLVSLLPLGLGFLWAAVDRRHQALHDKLAGTRVVVVADDVLDIDPAEVA